jgi:surface protein
MRNLISFRKKQVRFFSAPTVSGDTAIGSVLTATNGVFTGPTPTYTYQWFLEGSPIPGATGSTYTIPALSNGILRCVVKATNSQGSVKSTSNFFTIRNSFDFVVKTDNISTGSSTAAQFKLPFVSNGIYNCTVYWGDGTSDIITAWDQAQTTHTYATAGTYNVSITGTCNGWRFANAGDRLKLLSVGWWGVDFRLGATDRQFDNCANLDLSKVRDVLDLTGTTSFTSLFFGNGSLTKINRVNEWDTSNITSLQSTFLFCFNFNDNLGNWNTSNVTNMDSTFRGQGIFNDAGVGNWDTGKVTTMFRMFEDKNRFNQDLGNWNTSNVTNMSRMFFIATATNNKGVFNNAGIGNWNTSKVTNMQSMFWNQANFNQDISTRVVTVGLNTYTAWDTLNVVDMAFMFGNLNNNAGNSGAFNQNIGNWNTSKVTLINQMFQLQPNFNQDISTKVVTVGASTYTAWDTLNVTNMTAMFYGSFPETIGTFNQNIGNWNTSKVTTIWQMFTRQPNFNQDISTKTVTVGASTYTAWNTSNITDMRDVFLIGNDSTGSFNQNISNWNTSKVTNMISMFRRQPNFNQNIGIWDVSKVTNMTAMLLNTTNFNQNLGNWNISLVTSFNSTTDPAITFADGIGLSTANYDALLIGWASRPVQPNLAINFGTIKYSSAAVAARAILTSAPNNWTIVDGGEI